MCLTFRTNVISEPPRHQIALRIAFSDSWRCRGPVWITFGQFRKNQFSRNGLCFARVTFHFSAQEQSAWKVSADMKAVSGRIVAQAAQVASAQPERVRSTLLHTGDTGKSWEEATMKMMIFCGSPDGISEPSRPQKKLKHALYHLRCWRNMRPPPPANLELKRETNKSKDVPEIDNLFEIKKKT